MTDFRIGQRVRTTVDAPAAWEGALSVPKGSLGTIASLPSPYGGYGVRIDDDPSGLEPAYDADELTAVER
ncbi:hypothetical protein ABZX95_16895 [Streptomyces sp. NPDC004232]|uniref:hypothetical protein n=1 Tax=Streptomyces sp. NPDC004232 TaxID=3154454 RepID=UPI0033A8366F